MRYKTLLVAQQFSQMSGIDFDETYSLVMSMIIFYIFNWIGEREKSHYLINGCGNCLFV